MPITAALVASVAAPVAGGLVGKAMSAGDADAAKQAQLNYLKQLQGVPLPVLQQLKLQQLQSVGQVNPALEQAISQGASEMNGVTTDPRLKEAQMGALASLQKLGASGMRPEDIAMMSQISRQADQAARSQQAAALQDMQQRGQGGSGAEMAARLAAAQGTANRISQQGLDIGGQASQRALQAIAQSGALGGQMQSQDFNQQAQRAAAQDAINRFNAANKQAVLGQNVGAQNQAQYYNLGNQQRIADQNVGINNQQAQYNNSLGQQNFNNMMNKLGAQSGATQGAANAYQNSAAQTQNMYSGIGQGVGQAASAYGANKLYQDRTAAMNPSTQAPTTNSSSGSLTGYDYNDPNKLFGTGTPSVA